nr:FmdB family zinc ribbon protein [Brachybacterium fresconis]
MREDPGGCLVPTYVYACKSCGHRFEQYQSFSEDSLVTCPECTQDALRKVFDSVGIVFKGSGFYSTDSANSATSSQSSSGSSSGGSSDGSSAASDGASSTGSSADGAAGSGSSTSGSSTGGSSSASAQPAAAAASSS